MFSFLSVALMAAPFAWALLYLLFEDDPSERAERLLALWPHRIDSFSNFRVWEREERPERHAALAIHFDRGRAGRFSVPATLGLDLRHLAVAR